MNISNKTISIAFIVVLIVTVGVSVIGMSLMSRQPMVLQGQVEATEIRISGKLPGRVDSFLVQEGDWVKAGDTHRCHQQSHYRSQIPSGKCFGTGGAGTEQKD